MYRSFILCFSAIVGLVCAQGGGVPACATPCITLPAQCNGDPGCICKDQQWISDISCCIFKACDTAGQQQALAYAQNICTPVGATLPAAASCNNSTSNGTSSSAASTSASATGSAAASSASKSASSASSSAAAASSSAAAKSGAGIGNKAAMDTGLGIVGAMFAVALL